MLMLASLFFLQLPLHVQGAPINDDGTVLLQTTSWVQKFNVSFEGHVDKDPQHSLFVSVLEGTHAIGSRAVKGGSSHFGWRLPVLVLSAVLIPLLLAACLQKWLSADDNESNLGHAPSFGITLGTIMGSPTLGQRGMVNAWEASGDIARSLVSWHCTIALALALVLVFLLVGFVWEGWSPFISLYVLTQLITTIGFGDITPKSAGQKLCFCVMIIMCLVLIAHFVHAVFQAIQSREERFLRKAVSMWPSAESGVYHAVDMLRLNRNLLNFYISSASFASSIAFGVVFFAVVEPCSCSVGGKDLVGCVSSSPEACKQSGGYEKSWIDCLYFSLVTLTSIGFGDFAPTTTLGRGVGMLWMISGVCAAGSWIGTISTILFDEGQVQRRADSKCILDITKRMDSDGDGFISRSEHHIYMLLRNGLVSLDTLRELDTQFNMLSSKNGGEKVSIASVQLAFATSDRGLAALDTQKPSFRRTASLIPKLETQGDETESDDSDDLQFGARATTAPPPEVLS